MAKKIKKNVANGKKTKAADKTIKVIPLKKKEKKDPIKCWNNFAIITQWVLIAIVVAMIAFVTSMFIMNRNAISDEDFKANMPIFIILLSSIAAASLLAFGYVWYGFNATKRTHRTFMVMTILTAMFCAFVIAEEIALVFSSIQGTQRDIFTIVASISGATITSLVLAASQRSFAMKRTLGFLLSALVLSLATSIYINAVVVFRHDRSNLFIATCLVLFYLRTMVLATLTSIYIVRMFKMNKIKNNQLKK